MGLLEILDELETIADECLCHECGAFLTEPEIEQGYVCHRCIEGWLHEATWDEIEAL